MQPILTPVRAVPREESEINGMRILADAAGDTVAHVLFDEDADEIAAALNARSVAARDPERSTGEKALLVHQWLAYQHEDLSFGLRSLADAERLYDHFMAPENNLPEFADEGDLAAVRIAVLGYDPLGN